MNTPKLRALTLHPEWAWAILNLGKDVENRPPSVAKMVLNVIGTGRHGRPNDWLAIHAGKCLGGAPRTFNINVFVRSAARAGWAFESHKSSPFASHWRGVFWDRRPDMNGLHEPLSPTITGVPWDPDLVTRSAIVALTRVRPGNPDSPWAVPGQAQIGLRDLFVLPEPVPCGGKQGLWTVADEVAVKVLAQVKP